jgi:peroxiredoxin
MKRLIIIFFVLIGIGSSAQQKLEFKINGLEDTTVFLARYFGDRLYYADTTISKNGSLIFNTKKFVSGVYAVVCPGSNYFELVVADEDVLMETNIDDLSGKMVVKKSKNNKLFYGYIKFLGDKKLEANSLNGDKEKMKKIDLEVKEYQKTNLFNNPDLFAAKVLAMSVDRPLPEDIRNNDTLRYHFMLKHYWENIDVTDNRIIHSPVYHKKLENFFRMIPQHPDTICQYAHKLISQMDETSDLFKYTVHHITYKYETSNIMGMDAVFVCMANQYYCPEAETKAFWLDSTKLNELCEKAEKTEPLLVGKPAPRIILADTTQENWVDFYNLDNKYNLLMFWDPDCGHCKKEIPKLLNLYHELKDLNVDIEFIGLGTNLENEKWRKFIKDKQLDWLNLSDFPDANENPTKYLFEKKVTDLKSLNFRKTYDIFSTPQVYLVDREKKILGKRLDAITLSRMLQHMEGIEIEYLKTLEELQQKEKEKKDKAKKDKENKEK